MDTEDDEPEPNGPPGADGLGIDDIIQRAAQFLPAQGPISVFVHHNTLHAFEHLPFESAVVEAGALFECEPFLSEEKYREELSRLRILEHDLEEVVKEDLGDRASERPGRRTTRANLRLVMLRHPIHEERGAALRWLLAETDALSRFRSDVPEQSRRRLLYWAGSRVRRARSGQAERVVLESLWRSSVDAVSRVEPPPAPAKEHVRLRDLLLAVTAVDTDHFVHPLLIRLTAAFLDQGIAFWPMPERTAGLYRSFVALYGQGDSPFATWTRGLAAVLRRESDLNLSASESASNSLDLLGVQPKERERFITATLLALRGWAGMMHQLEHRPDRVPVHAPPAKLVDFLAVRLILERFALAHVARRELGYDGALSRLRLALAPRAPGTRARSIEERAYVLFQVSQILGRTPDDVGRLSDAEISQVLDEMETFSERERRRVFHLAYERRHRAEVLDAIATVAAVKGESLESVSFQAIFCIDEREESIRRHLEEIDPRAETFGTPGFFGVAMYYRSADAPHAIPLCPIGIRPEHEVREEITEELQELYGRRTASRRFVGLVVHRLRLATRTLTGGTVLTVSLGIFSAVPLVFRVLLPRLTSWMVAASSRWMARPRETRIALERDDSRTPSVGKWCGFTIDEMAAIVQEILEDTGLGRRLASIVLVIGHGSASLNNPHESAHDCGACGGGRGGPNARAFAQMANHPSVRKLLRDKGLDIPDPTLFVGGYHDTCDDAIALYDLEGATQPQQLEVARIRGVLEKARARNAHERCRRFESAPPWLTPSLALTHVAGRARDLAQVRPEYGHATNAVCFVGRRSRIRGLFFDRRAFLVSYDPEGDDPEASALGRTLSAVIPVGAGISLEYYFSYVDPVGYGCGTKLPHNITGLVGVMDGYRSDLRTGLPWQMVEIHEPVRLLVIVETSPELLTRVVERNEAVGRLARNRWIQLATLSPEGSLIHVLGPRGFERYEPEWMELPVVTSSEEWYGGQSEHLRPARIVMSSNGGEKAG